MRFLVFGGNGRFSQRGFRVRQNLRSVNRQQCLQGASFPRSLRSQSQQKLHSSPHGARTRPSYDTIARCLRWVIAAPRHSLTPLYCRYQGVFPSTSPMDRFRDFPLCVVVSCLVRAMLSGPPDNLTFWFFHHCIVGQLREQGE